MTTNEKLKVRVSFTVEIDYGEWKQIRESYDDRDSSKSAARDNVRALAEQAFENTMTDYVEWSWV